MWPKEWTDIFDCDEDGYENRVAVYDPYGTCALVLCAEHNGGAAGAGPIDFPPEPEEEDGDADWEAQIKAAEAKVEADYRRYLIGRTMAQTALGLWVGWLGACFLRSIVSTKGPK